MIVPVTEENEIYLIGLYRYPTQMYSWEVPGGAVENNDVLASAKSELQEETGLVAEKFEDLGIYQAMNGSVNKIGHVILALGINQTESNKQFEEGITQMKKLPFKKALEMVKDGEITDSHTISAIMLVGLKLGLLKTS